VLHYVFNKLEASTAFRCRVNRRHEAQYFVSPIQMFLAARRCSKNARSLLLVLHAAQRQRSAMYVTLAIFER